MQRVTASLNIPRDAAQPGVVSVEIRDKVRNADRIYINDFKLKLQNAAPVPFIVQLEFDASNENVTTKDIQTTNKFQISTVYDLGTNTLREQWSYPGMTLSEIPGRNVPFSVVKFRVTDENGAIIDFQNLFLRFAIEYSGQQAVRIAPSYNASPVPSHSLSTLGLPY